MKCECDVVGVLEPDLVHLYHPTKERPFVKHQPGECQCTNDVHLYMRAGKRMYLCSCCFRSTDTLVTMVTP